MSVDLIECHRLHEIYLREGWRPRIDPQLEIVLIDCPHCRAQESDSLGMWRPVHVVPRKRQKLLTISCTACGRRDERRL